jgi:hypothetical protein
MASTEASGMSKLGIYRAEESPVKAGTSEAMLSSAIAPSRM